MRKSLLTASIGLVLAGLSSVANATDLVTAYQDAVKNDPITLKAQASYQASLHGEDIAFSNLLPKLNLGVDYNASNTESISSTTGEIVTVDSNTLGYGISLSQTIFKMSDWYQLDAAEKRALQSLTSYNAAKQSLIQRIAQAYFNILKAEDSLEFAKAEKKAIERQLEQTRERFKVGLTAITDVHEAQANFDSAVATEIRSQNDVEIAKESLREITGNYYNDFNALNTERFEATLPMPNDVMKWVKKAEQSNLDLKVRDLAVQIAKFDIERAQAGHYPTVSLTANIGTTDRGGDVDSPALDSSNIRLDLNVPLYSGGATSSATDQARSNYVISSQDREQTYRSVVRNVRTSFADVSSLVSTIKALEQSVVSAESALQATEAGFEVGTRTIVDVLNSTRNLFNAKRNLSSTRYNYILAMLALKQAAGDLTSQDLVAVNSGLEK